MQRPVNVSDSPRVQTAGLAVTATLAQELRVQVAQVRWLERLELHAADGWQGVELKEFAIPIEGTVVTAEGLHVLEPGLHELGTVIFPLLTTMPSLRR